MTQIPPKVASRLLDSVAFMNSEFGVAFNGILTLNFDQLGLISPRQAAHAMTALNEAVGRKLKRFGARWGSGEHHFLYAHEGCRKHGHHVHELVVMPDGLRLDFAGWLQTWARRRFDCRNPNAVHFRPASRAKTLDAKAETQARLVRYVLKHMAPAGTSDREGNSAQLHDVLGLADVSRSTHAFEAHRVAGVSQSISRAAQMRAGYQPHDHFEDLLSVSNLLEFRDRQHGRRLTESLRSLDI